MFPSTGSLLGLSDRQSDFTHYPLTDTTTFPKGVEIITWLDDCTRLPCT